MTDAPADSSARTAAAATGGADKPRALVVGRMAALFKPYWLWLSIGIAFSMLFGLTEPLLLYLLKPILDHGNAGAEPEPLTYAVPVAIVLLAVGRGFLLFASTYLLDRVAETLKSDLMARTVRHTLEMPLSHFHEEDSTIMLRRVALHVGALKDAFLGVISPMVQGIAKILGYVGLLLYTQWQLALTFLVVMPLLGVVMSKYARRWRVLYKAYDETEGGFGQYLIEIFRSARVVKAYCAEDAESRRYAAHLKRMFGIGMRTRIAINVSRVAIQVCVALMFAVAIVVGINFYNDGKLTIGELGVFTGALLLLPIAIRRVTDILPRFYEVSRSADVVFGLLDSRTETDGDDGAAGDLADVRGEIEFRNVSFGYPGADARAVTGLDLTVRAGEKVALVGKTGSGKSTMINLLLRFYDPSEGEVLLDGKNLKTLSRRELRRQFSWVTQEPHLFSGSVASNIGYPDDEIDMARVEAAATRATLTDFIRSLPNGFDSQIGESGVNLSGGQRQRLSIARALYRSAPILLLDEISSALDSVTEAGIYDELSRFARDRTMIVISHRLSPIRNVDRIVLLSEGKIEAEGTHEELLETNPSYRRLCETQRLDEESAPKPASDGG